MQSFSPTIHGTTAPGFEPVKTAFLRNFTVRGEIGASVCVYHRGRRVVDLWGGMARLDSPVRWRSDTLVNVFSVTKGLTATTLLLLADRGELELERPVAYYWPGFARHGKGQITVRQLLNHRSGLSAVDRPLSLDDLADPDRIVDALEDQVPLWEPGTGQGYMATSFGMYAAELFRRVTGTTVGTYLRTEIAEPLGADVHIGLATEHLDRVARVYPLRKREVVSRLLPRAFLSPKVEGRVYRQMLRKNSDTRRAFGNPAALGVRGIQNFNTARVHQMELCWGNGQASARGLARVYAALAQGGTLDGVRLVRPSTVDALRPRQSWENDRVIRRMMGFSQGFLKDQRHVFGPETEAFGHPGAGGALGWADPKNELSIGYVMNRMDLHIRSPRATALCHAVYASLS